MLGDKNAVANLAVRNLDTAKKFYADTIASSRSAVRATSWSSSEAATPLSMSIGRTMPEPTRRLR